MKKLFIIFILSVTVFSCKRYEENPAISFRSIVERINGRWEIESTTVNSISSSTSWDTLKTDWYNYSFSTAREKRKNHSDMDGFIAITFIESNVVALLLTDFSEDKKELRFWSHYPCYNFPNCNAPFPLGNIPGFINNHFEQKTNGYYLQEVWEIKKLTNKELWLTSELNGNSYETHFKKMEDP